MDRLINHAVSYPLALVIAGAGFGKTTAVREWLKKADAPHAWISLTDGDSEVFWDKLCDAVDALNSGAADELRIIGLPRNPWEASRIVKMLREHCTEPVIVCIDDFHHIPDDSPVLGLLNTLLFEQIDNLHLVMLSRREPAIPVGTLVSKERCAVISEDELRFNDSETAGYLSMRGLRLTKSAVEQINRSSGGWVSAIFLMSEGIRSGSSITERRDIERLFSENLMVLLSEQERELLYRLAPLEPLPAECAVEAMGDSGAARLLDRLVKENAFVTVDDQAYYRFHPLLRDYLVRFCPEDETQRNAYCRAGLWYLDQKELPGSFSVALFDKAGCTEEFLERLNHPGVHRLNYFDTEAICAVSERLPDDECTIYPFPYLQIIFFLLLSGEPRNVRIANAMHRTMQEYFSSHEHPYRNRILGELIVISRITGFGDVPKGIEPLEEASRLLGGHYSDTLRTSDPFTFGLPMLLESEWMRAGELDAAVDRCQYNPYELVADGFGRGSEQLVLAEAALLRCRMNEARIRAMQADEEAEQADQWFVMASAQFVLMRIALYTGNHEEAVAQLSALRSLVLNAERVQNLRPTTVPMLRETVALSECFLNTSLLRENDIPLDFRDGTHKTMMVGLGIPEVFCARAMLVIGNASGAERLCKRIDHLHAVCQEARITRLIIEALARERLYGKGTGVSLMREALEKAQPDGVLLPFAETLDVRTSLRVKGIVGDAGETFLSQVRQACDVYAQTSYRQSQSSSAVLSQRELEILRLAARGMTRAQIANEACIKEDTVKKHLSAAYRKLGASNRTEALRTARIEGLL